MIISHKHKFIFIKPTKVAGTSIEIALGKFCGEEDIITPITEFNPQSDSYEFVQTARNYEALGYFNHITPDEIKARIGEEIWNAYYKFTIVRNPWDQMVSRFFWNKQRPKPEPKKKSPGDVISKFLKPDTYVSYLKKAQKGIIKAFSSESDFEKFIRFFNRKWTNTRYYFDEAGNPICDFYIRYENLDSDYKKVCDHLGIPYEQLPMTKNKQRKEKKHYTEFYTPKAQEKVRVIFNKEVEFFKYTFGGK